MTSGWLVSGTLFLLMGLIGCEPSAPPRPTLTPDWPAEVLLLSRSAPVVLSGQQYLALADAYEESGNSRAAFAYRQAAADLLDEVGLWRSLAAAYQAAGNWQAARHAFEAVVRLVPDDPQAHYWLGVILAPYAVRSAYNHLEHAVDDAILGESARVLRDAIVESQLDSPDEQNLQIGMALAKLEHWPQAEQAFANATALDPASETAWAYLGLAQAQQGVDSEAAFNQAFGAAPDEPLYLFLYGLALRALGSYEKSQVVLAEAQALAPENPAFSAELGTAYRLIGDNASAEYWLRAAVQQDPANLQFLNLLALFYADEAYNLTGNGLSVLQEAAALEPDNADIQAAYAWGLYNSGEVTAAQETMTLARSLDPMNPRALYYQGLLYQLQSQSDLAMATLARLLDHPQPEGFDTLARRVLERLDYHGS